MLTVSQKAAVTLANEAVNNVLFSVQILSYCQLLFVNAALSCLFPDVCV